MIGEDRKDLSTVSRSIRTQSDWSRVNHGPASFADDHLSFRALGRGCGLSHAGPGSLSAGTWLGVYGGGPAGLAVGALRPGTLAESARGHHLDSRSPASGGRVEQVPGSVPALSALASRREKSVPACHPGA